MEMVGVIWVTRPQYGREPPAAARRIVCMNKASWGLASMPDRNAPPIREQDRGDVDRDALAMWVDLRP